MPSKEYYQRHKKRLNAKGREQYRQNPTPARERHFVLTYGITLAQRDSIFESQGFKCAICSKWKKLNIDHVHKNGQKRKHRYVGGKVRGALCNRCNAGLGFFFDDPKLFRAAALYLEKFAAQDGHPDRHAVQIDLHFNQNQGD